ncbi:MAG: P-loop NTPase [Hyphomicrobiaceae bacterium]
MTASEDQVMAALKRIRGPDLKGNIVDLHMVSEVLIKDGKVSFAITVPADRGAELEPLRQAAEKVVGEIDGVTAVTVVLTADREPGSGPRAESPRVAAARAAATGGGRPAVPQRHAHGAGAAPRPNAVQNIRHLIAVASGKGGVGKSTVSVNLALGLSALGLHTGLMDADVYGPSQPRLLGLTGRPTAHGNRLEPMRAYGIQVMSMGLLVDEATPIIWRGPMVVSALNQMLREVEWGEPDRPLDVLIIDMPPGTGDIQLSMAQQVPLSGAVIVSTPQDLALIDARKGLAMFQKVDVPVLGIIENMSYFQCPKCGERSEIFGHGGARDEAGKLGLPFLGAIPLNIEIRSRSDAGQPVVASSPESESAAIFREIAGRVWEEIGAGGRGKAAAPHIDITEGGTGLKVAFEDGRTYQLPAELLRVTSPSAEVQGHSPSQRVTVAGKRNVKIRELRPVGNYAIRIVFDDGHDTGLYSWSYLEHLGRDRDKHMEEYLAELNAKGLSRG